MTRGRGDRIRSTRREWIQKMWYIYTMEYYSSIKKNEFMKFLAKLMDLEGIILSEVTHSQRNSHNIYSLISSLFVLLTVSFALQKLCSFMRSHLSILDLTAQAIVVLLWKSVWRFLRKLDMVLWEDPAIPLLGIYPEDVPTSKKDTCSTMLIAALFQQRNGYRKCGTFTQWSTTQLLKRMNL